VTFKYRLGQKVEVLQGKFHPSMQKYVGLIGIIVERKHFPRQDIGTEHYAEEGNYYIVDGCPESWILERRLKPINDGDNPSTWDECAWRPNLEHPIVPTPTEPTKETA